MNKNNLKLHSLPVLAFAFSLVLGFGSVTLPAQSLFGGSNSIAKGLTTKAFTVQPTSYGLGSIRVNDNNRYLPNTSDESLASVAFDALNASLPNPWVQLPLRHH